MSTLLQRIRHDERGASIIELGIAAPILAMLFVGMTDLSRAYSAKLQLEQAAQRSIEYVQRTGFTPGQEDTIKAEATQAAGTGSSATLTTWAECRSSAGAVTTKTFTDPCTGAASYARYVSVDVQKSHTPFFRFKWNKSARTNYVLHGKAAIRVQ